MRREGGKNSCKVGRQKRKGYEKRVEIWNVGRNRMEEARKKYSRGGMGDEEKRYKKEEERREGKKKE